VTGVQTCALPICGSSWRTSSSSTAVAAGVVVIQPPHTWHPRGGTSCSNAPSLGSLLLDVPSCHLRSDRDRPHPLAGHGGIARSDYAPRYARPSIAPEAVRRAGGLPRRP